MKVGDLVRNVHTVFGSISDERGIVLELIKATHNIPADCVRVVWHNSMEIYQAWMARGDLEVISESR